MRFLLLACLLMGAFGSRAQQVPAVLTTPAQVPAATSAAAAAVKTKATAGYHAAAPEQRAERLSQAIGKQLGLDAATTAKVKAAALVRAQKIDAIQTGSDTNKAKNTALQANAQDFKAALKGILTPAQFASYTTRGAKAATE